MLFGGLGDAVGCLATFTLLFVPSCFPFFSQCWECCSAHTPLRGFTVTRMERMCVQLRTMLCAGDNSLTHTPLFPFLPHLTLPASLPSSILFPFFLLFLIPSCLSTNMQLHHVCCLSLPGLALACHAMPYHLPCLAFPGLTWPCHALTATCRAMPCHVRILSLPYLALPCFVWPMSCPAMPCLAMPYMPCHVMCLALPCLAFPCPALQPMPCLALPALAWIGLAMPCQPCA